MIEFAIYQLKDMRGTEYGFMRWEFAKAQGFDLNHYESVYESTLTRSYRSTSEILEDLFYIFNMQRPEDFQGHSLSVSDLVKITDNGSVSYWYCDSFRWVDVTDFILHKKGE